MKNLVLNLCCLCWISSIILLLMACLNPSAEQPVVSEGIAWATHTPINITMQAELQPTVTNVDTTPTMTTTKITNATPTNTVTRITNSVTNTPIPSATPTLTATATITSPTIVTDTIHTIAVGDTLLDLAYQYEITLDAILEANSNLDPTNLQIGQSVLIPGAGDIGSDSMLQQVTPSAVRVIDYASMESDMLDEVNVQREGRQMHFLIFDSELREVARGHARDMAERNFFDHVTPEGITLRDRLRTAGIVKNWVGENIQVNTHPPDQAAEEAMRWFLGSEPHMNNILAEPFTRLGVGVAEGPPGWYIFVLVFSGES
ncbi:MAG: CAP domain-containing protein [Chloroflexota bacterium]